MPNKRAESIGQDERIKIIRDNIAAPQERTFCINRIATRRAFLRAACATSLSVLAGCSDTISDRNQKIKQAVQLRISEGKITEVKSIEALDSQFKKILVISGIVTVASDPPKYQHFAGLAYFTDQQIIISHLEFPHTSKDRKVVAEEMDRTLAEYMQHQRLPRAATSTSNNDESIGPAEREMRDAHNKASKELNELLNPPSRQKRIEQLQDEISDGMRRGVRGTQRKVGDTIITEETVDLN